MEEEIVNPEVITDSQGEPKVLKPEEQEAINRYRESQKSQAEKEEGIPEGYNEDGTPTEELIDGKFKSQEDLLKAYKELEKKMSQPEQPKQEEATQEEAPTEVVNDRGTSVDVSKFESEFRDNGNLSEESYKELEKLGFSKRQVDQYIQGQTHYGNMLRSQIFESAGGEEAYTELVQWASANMDRATIEEYNQALVDSDETKIYKNLEYMKLKRGWAAPSQPRRLTGDSPAVGLQPFTDKNEWQKAATNRLYGKDPKYTNMVDQRYLASRKKGIL